MRNIKPDSRGLTACVPGMMLSFFLLLPPLLDVVIFFQESLGIPALAMTVICLTAFLGVSGFGFWLSHRKRYYVIAMSVALLYLAGHILAICGRGYRELRSDLTDQLRTLMPFFLTAATMRLCGCSDRARQAMKSGVILVLGLIALMVLLSVLTESDSHSHAGKQSFTLFRLFGLKALIAFLRRPNQVLSMPLCTFALVYGTGTMRANFTASVLRRNNASVYMAFLLPGLCYLSREPGQQETES